MPLVSLNQVSIAFGAQKLLDHANLVIERGERIGLLGRNGEGKSTLLSVIGGRLRPDDGELRFDPGIRVAMLEQAPSLSGTETIYDIVAEGLGSIGADLAEYHHAIIADDAATDAGLQRIAAIQQRIDAADGWRLGQRVEKVLSRLGLSADDAVTTLSGGWQRRVSLARALVAEPQVLLLDEPTNHLDIASIEWLENQILQFQGAVLFVTHDRTFLKRVANRIVDLDRGALTAWTGSYEDYLRRKAAADEQEARQNAEFDRKLAREEVWIRKGIQARRTRNEGRVRALIRMRSERAERREKQGKVKLNIDQADNSGKLVMEAKNVSFAWGDKIIARDFSTRILRGDRIGLIGPNGIGKTTLIRLLLGEQQPDSGHIRLGHNLKVAWFDQLRTQVDPESTVVDAIGEGRDKITVGGRERHVISYLSDFLFAPARARSPIRSLSGGERARVLLAKLFSKPANVLVMDEPTNDLDIETLELVEEMLLDFAGTLILVSHDRQFMDNVVTSTLALEGDGRIQEYVGGYSDWERQRPVSSPAEAIEDKIEPAETVAPEPVEPVTTKPSKKKLGYREQQELAALPARIEELETLQSTLTATVSEGDFYRGDPQVVERTLRELDEASKELEQCYQRWEVLEG
ncbi:MAG: ATP-binding cassette domain-containing protein [Acidiferrobacterales bacterium]|nr:ATP-binding cassette domain-containing protein [Acidiferrobacterales bacterium]